MSVYEPLHTPGRMPEGPFDLDAEITATMRVLAETAGLNIHSDADMQTAAFALDRRLRVLLAAVQAERGERR